MSQALEDELRARICRGDLSPGSRINEVHVAGALGVSRTPLREALTRLAGEAFVEARPKLGFYVRSLSATEAAELYVIRARLDPWALSLAGLPDAAAISELESINGELARATRADDAIERDDAWHLRLLAACPNTVLLGLIRQMMWRTRRYEYAYFSDAPNRATAVAEHARLIATARAGDLGGACRWLEQNLSTAVPVLEQKLGEP